MRLNEGRILAYYISAAVTFFGQSKDRKQCDQSASHRSANRITVTSESSGADDGVLLRYTEEHAAES